MGDVEKNGTVEKGDRHRAGDISCRFDVYLCSEPVPLFHYLLDMSPLVPIQYGG